MLETAAHDAIEARGKSLGLALSADELRRIAEVLHRRPTDTELYAFDAQWSEHCSYKSSRRHLRKLPTDGPTVMQGPAEDAGILHLGEWQGARYGVVIAHESHNHPSQVVPFEGAATGVGGIVRDVLCMGAEVIALADPLRFGRLDDPHCRYVAQSVVDGIAAYGNAIGVPTIAGDVYVDESFDDNVLVNVVALGLVKEPDIIHSKAPPGSEGYDIVLVGKATDRSGFGGASFSSLTLDEADAETNKGAVQVPDPFLKNVIMRASYRVFEDLRREGIVAGFKDLGAGGLTGCSAELVASGGMGAEIDLDKAPVTDPELPPAVIAIGETQERLCWIVPPSFTPRLLAIYNDEFWLPRIAKGACAAAVGTVTATQRYVARYRGETVIDVPLRLLTDGVRYNRPYTVALPDAESFDDLWRRAGTPLRGFNGGRSTGDCLEAVVAHRDVCSREPIFQRFDGVVRGTTAVPRGYADAGVIVPIADAPFGVALAVDGNPRYGKIDPQRAAELAVVEAACNVAAVGARPIGMTDCLNFGDPTEPRQLGDMVAAIDGLAHAARMLATPFVSGNVSLYNQSKSGRSVAPSPIVACVGAIADIAKTATSAFKRAGSPLYFLGAAQPAFGGSVYAEVIGFTSNALAVPDYAATRRYVEVVLAAYEAGIVLAAHDVSDGGLITAIAEMIFPTLSFAPVGARLHHPDTWDATYGDEVTFFAEYGGFVIEAADGAAFEGICRAHGAAFAHIGVTSDSPVLVLENCQFEPGEQIDMHRVHEAWSAPLRDFYGGAA
ncbi:MAG: phosphoribosylformylglycinamidine synthase subunit PurL [Candidatus Velthaea sp.]